MKKLLLLFFLLIPSIVFAGSLTLDSGSTTVSNAPTTQAKLALDMPLSKRWSELGTTDFLSGWDFTSGWNIVASGAISDANTFTATETGGGIRARFGTIAGQQYKLIIAGDTDSTNTYVRGYGSTTGIYLSNLTGTFSETCIFTAEDDDDGGLSLRNTGTNTTTNITTLELYDITGTTQDRSPNNNNGTRVGTTWTTDRNGNAEGALSFNGTSDYVDLGTSVQALYSDRITVSFWADTSSVSGIIHPIGIFDASDLGFLFVFSETAGEVYFYSGGATSSNRAKSPYSFSGSTWAHFAGVYDGTDTILYVNGVPQIDAVTPLAPNTMAGATSVDLFIGKSVVGNYFAGSIDDLRIYPFALTQAEITARYNTDKQQMEASTTQAKLALDMPLSSDWSEAGPDMNISACENSSAVPFPAPYDTFDEASATGFHAVHSTTGTQVAGTADEIVFVEGEEYVAVFTATLTSGQAPVVIPARGLNATILAPGQDVVAGHNVYIFISNETNTGVVEFYNTANSEYTISDLSVVSTSGTTQDRSPFNNNGTRVGTTWTTDRNGNAEGALEFVLASDDNITFNSPVIAQTNYSISLWARPDVASNNFILDNRDSSTDGVRVSVDLTTGYIRARHNTVDLVGDISVVDGMWHHVAVTSDGTTLTLYVDMYSVTADISGAGAISVTTATKIGTRNFSTVSNSYDGGLAAVRVNNRALSQTEVTAVYNAR